MQQEKYLIIGLGNPGKKYVLTYHNLGFIVLDHLLAKVAPDVDFALTKKMNAKIAKTIINNKQVILVKPQTFMNLSGQATIACVNYFKIPLENILIVHDDSDLELGRIRFVKNSGAGGHNGINSIIQSLGTKNFARLKIGIRSSAKYNETITKARELVLKQITKSDQLILKRKTKTILSDINCFLKHKIEMSCNLYNGI